jgi:ATP-dependent DNA helicase DinG
MEDRPQQDTAAHAIEQAIEDSSILVCQAGTGVGKSNAALIPAITSGKKVVYATATKVLQSQIVEKDLPFLQQHLGIDFTFASLKGWNNYVCHAKLAEFQEPAVRQSILDEFDADPDHIGDQDTLVTQVATRQWMDLSMSSDECPGVKECPFGAVCKPGAARERLAGADVKVVNHSLLATDARVRSMTGGNFSLIGEVDVLIVDEAHELEEFISSVLGDTFTEGSVRHFATQLRAFSRRANIESHIEPSADTLEISSGMLFSVLEPGRLRLSGVHEHLEQFEELFNAYVGIRDAITDPIVLDKISKIAEPDRKTVRNQRERLYRQVMAKITSLHSVMLSDDTELVRQVEETRRVVRGQQVLAKALKTTPVNVGPWAKENIWEVYNATVLVSATVLVDRKSDYIASRLGLEGHITLDAGTPFDYPSQARLYVPRNIPEPTPANRNAWATVVLEEIRDLVEASQGGALLLFTSNKQMLDAYNALHHRIHFPTRKQGDDTNNRLMDWFRNEHDGVLFATRSFFTGASFEGDTCRLVVIDKLPFPVPTDPIFEARSEQIKRRGGNDFNELSVPMMTLPLQQGFGRLIRTKSDTGVVAILDPRLITKGYGAKIVNSLPPATKIERSSDVAAFFEAQRAAAK